MFGPRHSAGGAVLLAMLVGKWAEMWAFTVAAFCPTLMDCRVVVGLVLGPVDSLFLVLLSYCLLLLTD